MIIWPSSFKYWDWRYKPHCQDSLLFTFTVCFFETRSHYEDQGGLQLRDPPDSGFQVLEVKVCANTLGEFLYPSIMLFIIEAQSTQYFYKVILMCAFSKEIPYLFLYNCLLHFSGAFQSERGWKKLGRKLHRQLLLSLVWNVRKDAVLWGFHLLLWLLKWKWIFSTCFSHRSLEDYLKVQVTCTVGDGLCFHLKINATVVHL